MPPEEGPRIELVGVTVGYGGSTVLENVDLVLDGPGLVQVLGPNGAGKTTLLKTLLGLLRPLRGRVLINGVDVTGRPELAGRSTGYVPQLEPLARHYPVTPRELLCTECRIRCRGRPRGWVRGRVEEVLAEVGLPREKWDVPISRLSGGQKQRVFIARALVHDPPILVMDEPFSAVDPVGKSELAALIGSFSASKLAIVTSHDPMLLLDYTREIVLVNRGIVAHGPPEEVLQPETLAKVYGGAVLVVEKHPHIVDEHVYTRGRR